MPAVSEGVGESASGLIGIRRRLWRWLGLVTGLSAGLLFGISQQLRGAHFVSHDIWTLGICWATASLVSMAFWHAQAVEPELANEARATRA